MRSSRFVWIGLLVALSVGLGQGVAFTQKFYWTDELNGHIQKLDGTVVTDIFNTQAFGSARPANLIVDSAGGWIIWTDFYNGIHRVRLDGTNPETIVQIVPVDIDPH